MKQLGMVDVHVFVEVYNFCFEDGRIYTPKEHEKAMLEDAINGYIGECEQRQMELDEAVLPPHIVQFLKDNFPAEEDLAGYVICIAKRDKSYAVAQGYDSEEVRDKVSAKLFDEISEWVPQS